MNKLNINYVITFSIDPYDVWVNPSIGGLNMTFSQNYQLPENIGPEWGWYDCECDENND